MLGNMRKNPSSKTLIKSSVNMPTPATPLQQLLTKDVNRKEFLTIAGLGLLTIAGISPLIHFLTGKNPKTSVKNIYQTTDSASGYNRGRYNQ